MWVKYFNFTLLKNMDEDMAEEADDDRPDKRWLWPLTGEVHWQEKNMEMQMQCHQNLGASSKLSGLG